MLTADLAEARLWRGFSTDCPSLADHLHEHRAAIAADINRDILETVRATLRPKLRMRVDQCTDKFRYIPPEASANYGKMKVSTYEIGRGPMAAVTEPGVRKISVAGPTQLLKTTLLESTALYYMIIEPRPMMFLQPNEILAKRFSKTKINGMINMSPAAQAVMFKNLVLEKYFRGGLMAISNAGSKANMAQMAICVTGADETDKMPLLDGSHPVTLLEKRTETFGDDARNLRVCSPEFENGFIWEEYLAGDRRQPYVECPYCGHDHIMRWKPTDAEKEDYLKRHGREAPDRNVIWTIDPKTNNWEIESAAYHCPECGVGWNWGERLKAISKVKWRQTKPFTCCPDHPEGGYQEPERSKCWTPTVDPTDGYEIVGRATCRVCGDLTVPNYHASFNCSRLYSPVNLSKLVQTWKESSATSHGLKQFVNDELGEPWRETKAIQLSAEGLRARCEEYEYPMPPRAAILTAGADVQDDRIEIEKVAWGREFENWSVDYKIFVGDPADPQLWAKVDVWLNTPVEGVDGKKFTVAAACFDTGGHNTEHVYRYCLLRQKQRRWAIRGKAETGNRVAPIWPKSPTYVGSFKLALHELGTTAAKTFIAKMLARAMPGPFFCHFPPQDSRDENWFTGLLSEEQKMISGVYRWRPKHDKVRNEPLDCRVYALAALEGLKAEFNDPFLVEHRADKLGIGRTLTDLELQRFAVADEAFRIEQETKKALEQNRAKPVRKGSTKRIKGDKRKVAAAPPDDETVDEVATFARKSDPAVSSRPSDQRATTSRRPPGRKKAPFRYR